MTHAFICSDDGGNKFTIESDITDVDALRNKGVFCPHCGKKWGAADSKIQWNPSYQAVTRPSRDHLAKDNMEASNEAQRAAQRDLYELNRADPEIAPGVRKSLVDTIQARAEQVL